MTLVKLRLNTQFENLADQFNSSKSCTNDVFRRWINLMYVKLKILLNGQIMMQAIKHCHMCLDNIFPD